MALIGSCEACRRLGHISTGTLAYLVKQGRVTPAFVNERGCRFYTEDEIERFANVYPRSHMHRKKKREKRGSRTQRALEAKRVFEMLERGADLREIVKTGVEPERARELRKEWHLTFAQHDAEKRALEAERQSARDRAQQTRRELFEEKLHLKRRELEIRERELRRQRAAEPARPWRRGQPSDSLDMGKGEWVAEAPPDGREQPERYKLGQ